MKIFKRFLILVGVVFIISGCGNNKKEIMVTCTKSVKNESGEAVSVTDKSKFNSDQLLTYNEVVTVENGFTSDESYNEKKKSYANVVELMKDNNNYTFDFNDNKKEITVKLVADSFDLTKYTDEEKENIKATYRIKSYENSGYTCKISGISRKKLGLE